MYPIPSGAANGTKLSQETPSDARSFNAKKRRHSRAKVRKRLAIPKRYGLFHVALPYQEGDPLARVVRTWRGWVATVIRRRCHRSCRCRTRDNQRPRRGLTPFRQIAVKNPSADAPVCRLLDVLQMGAQSHGPPRV